MFFAISGFVIPSSLRGTRWQGFKYFVTRRFWRLYPPFWVVLALSIWCFPELYDGWTRLGWDAVMLPSFAQPKVWTHFWTLEIELFFYVLVAGLFISFGRIGGWVTFFAYSLISGLAAPYFLIYPIFWNSLLPHLAVMFWGATCREILYSDISDWPFLNFKGKGRAFLIGLVTAPIISGASILIYRGITLYGPISWSGVLGLGVSLLIAILGFLFWVVVARPVRFGWLSTVGRWTYSTYLLHAIVLWGIGKAVHLFPVLGGQSLLLYIFLALVLSFTVGAVAYRWIEQPSNRVGKWLTRGKR